MDNRAAIEHPGGWAMRKAIFLGMALILAVTFAGCGGDGGPDLVVTDILSSGGAYDGDITYDSVLDSYSVYTAADSPYTVMAGEDPAVSGIEKRGFITFPISSIPPGAGIRSATVLLPILSSQAIFPATSITLFVDMVTFPRLDTVLTQPDMAAYYDAAPILLGPSISVLSGFTGDKSFDATDALNEVRDLGYSTLQIRVTGSSGEVTIDDLDPSGLTPLLRVEYTR
jgi:hypothetical protein